MRMEGNAGPHGVRAGKMAGATGLEPATTGVTGRCSNQIELHPRADTRETKASKCLHCRMSLYFSSASDRFNLDRRFFSTCAVGPPLLCPRRTHRGALPRSRSTTPPEWFDGCRGLVPPPRTRPAPPWSRQAPGSKRAGLTIGTRFDSVGSLPAGAAPSRNVLRPGRRLQASSGIQSEMR